MKKFSDEYLKGFGIVLSCGAFGTQPTKALMDEGYSKEDAHEIMVLGTALVAMTMENAVETFDAKTKKNDKGAAKA